MENNENKRPSRRGWAILALIIVIISLFVIFFYPSDTPDPAAPDATDPVITVTKEVQ